MEGRKRAAVPLLALLFGLAAAGLSFLAYVKRIKVEDVSVDKQGVCIYPSSTAAFAIAIIATLFILIHQILITSGTACFCCGRKFPCNFCGIISFILFILSWISFVITFTGLVSSAIFNDKSLLVSKNDRITSGRKEECLMANETLFLGAAIWCVITMFFTLSSYATLMCARRRKDHDIPRNNFGA
ncbi:uncharacterized protein LOC141657157 [Silene latifolia]|uniref:uncharacterized protein LOC141657157 n=1 Tax=Silene latifolia TaxID=37657 RepID=UPI003D778086